METPNYIKALLQPNGKKGTGRKVWSIDLESIWLPFFIATNVQGDTAIPHDALGAPLRLAYDKDGSVKFSKAGRPTLKVAPELNQQIRLVRENFTAGLVNYAGQVVHQRPEDYQAEADACREAGEPITEKTQADIQAAIDLALEQAKAKAEAEKVVTETRKTKREKVAVAA